MEIEDARLSARADGWLALGLVAQPADRAEAEDGVRQAYELAGLPPPARVEWQGSPRSGLHAAVAAVASGEAGASVRGPVRTRPWARARAEVTERLGAAGWARYWAASGGRTWPLLIDRIVTPIRTRLDAEQETDRLRLLDAVHGQHDGAWLAAFEDDPALVGVMRVARSAGWWWPYENVAILTERPAALERDNLGRLHSGDGPALSYPDGWQLYVWRGMPIPPEVAAELPTLTVARIHAEPNAEVRRVMVEYYGFDRYLREADATRVHEDETGILWRVNQNNDEPLVMVEVINSTPEPDGTRRTYFLRVPPSIRTARAGVAWTFGLTADEYSPLAQT
jgi:hypothetical protein